jgi:hypothetical protein
VRGDIRKMGKNKRRVAQNLEKKWWSRKRYECNDRGAERRNGEELEEEKSRG